jgi:hypothetical protein
MRKLAFGCTAALTLGLAFASKPAAASSCVHACSPVFDVMGWGLVAGIVGGYAYGTGSFLYRDATDDTQSLEYGGTEVGVNGALGLLFATGAVDAARSGEVGSTVVYAAISSLHLALATHGAWRVYDRRADIYVSPDTMQRFAALGYGVNTVLWGAQLFDGERHSRGYGLAEAAVNAPIAAGLGYLALDHGRDGKTGPTLLFGTMTAISGTLVVHGLYTAVAPRRSPGLDVLGAELAPTVVTDGREVAPGLGAAGSW